MADQGNIAAGEESRPQVQETRTPQSHNNLAEDEDSVTGVSSVVVDTSNSSMSQAVAPSQTSIAAQTPKGEPKSMKQAVRKLGRTYDIVVADHWTWELLSMLVCAGTLASIVAILLRFNNRPTPHNMAGINLNTAISILATLCRAAAVLVSASVIAQQKWLNFERKPRSLFQVLQYDDATRGPLGSLYLLGTLRISLFTALAALVAVLALGFEPFVQQSVKYPLRDQVVGGSSPKIPTVNNVTFAKEVDANLTVAMNAVIAQALFADYVGPLSTVCGGTTCEWPDYKSVAVCSSCEDAMKDVNISPKHDMVLQGFTEDKYLDSFYGSDLDRSFFELSKTWNTTYTISLGQGNPVIFSVNASSSVDLESFYPTSMLQHPETIVWNLLVPSDDATRYVLSHDNEGGVDFMWRNITINGSVGPLKAFGFVNLTRSPDGNRLIVTSAQRCVISLCAKQYSSTFHNGSLSSRVMQHQWGAFHPIPGHEEQWLSWMATVDGSRFGGGFFNLSNMILIDIYAPLTKLEGSLMRWYKRYSGDTTGVNNQDADFMQFISDIRNNSAKIAQGLSNFIQQNGDSHATGQAYVSKPFVEVRWAWLSYPVTLVLVVLVTLIATIVQTKKRGLPTWKSSPFPLLYNYRDQDQWTLPDGEGDDSFTPRAVATSRHEEMAKETRLRLRSNAGLWRFEQTP